MHRHARAALQPSGLVFCLLALVDPCALAPLACAVSQPAAPPSNALFDASGKFLIYPSVVGIKCISVGSSKLARLLGKVENTERFAYRPREDHLCNPVVAV